MYTSAYGSGALVWPVPVADDEPLRFPYGRALSYVAAELSQWTGRPAPDDPGAGEVAADCAKVRAGLSQAPGVVDEALSRCYKALYSADLLLGAAPMVRLRHVRTACLEAASARALCLAVDSPTTEPAVRVVAGEVLAIKTV